MSFVIIVEGSHDKLFLEKTLIPRALAADVDIDILMSSNWSSSDYERQIRLFDGAIILKDLDDEACPVAKKNKICADYNLHSHRDKIVITMKEIEGWYVAGGSDNLPKLPSRFHGRSSTENISKEDLKNEVYRTYKWRRHEAALVELARNYSFDTAKLRNSSMRYFLNKLESLTGLAI